MMYDQASVKSTLRKEEFRQELLSLLYHILLRQYTVHIPQGFLVFPKCILCMYTSAAQM